MGADTIAMPLLMLDYIVVSSQRPTFGGFCDKLDCFSTYFTIKRPIGDVLFLLVWLGVCLLRQPFYNLDQFLAHAKRCSRTPNPGKTYPTPVRKPILQQRP